MGDLREYLPDWPEPPDGLAGLNAAAHAARDLVAKTISTLRDTGSGTRRRPRFVLTPRRRRRLRERRMHEFLEHQVYDTSVTLMCGVLQLRDAVYGAPKDVSSTSSSETDRKRLLADLTSPSGPDHAGLVQSLAKRDDLDARVRYNLACYWSRALSYDFALAQLRRAMQDAVPGVLKLICLQAATDPALAPLRTQRRESYTQLLKTYGPPPPPVVTRINAEEKKPESPEAEIEQKEKEKKDAEREEKKRHLAKPPSKFDDLPGYLGSVWPESGIQFVARGLARLRDKGPDVRVVLLERTDARELWRTGWHASAEPRGTKEEQAKQEQNAEMLLNRLLMIPTESEAT